MRTFEIGEGERRNRNRKGYQGTQQHLVVIRPRQRGHQNESDMGTFVYTADNTRLAKKIKKAFDAQGFPARVEEWKQRVHDWHTDVLMHTFYVTNPGIDEMEFVKKCNTIIEQAEHGVYIRGYVD